MSLSATRLWELLPLLLLAIACALLLTLVSGWAGPYIEQNRQQLRLQPLAGILPAGLDVAALGRGRLLSAPELLGSEEPVRVYRLQDDGRWQGSLIEIVSHNGYRGDILMGVVIDADGRLIGVRALVQHETRGLGDGIDYRVSPWLEQFHGRGLEPEQDWRLRAAGGTIDQLSGATVTSRAVLRAVHSSMQLFAAYRDLLQAWPQPDCAILSRAQSACP